MRDLQHASSRNARSSWHEHLLEVLSICVGTAACSLILRNVLDSRLAGGVLWCVWAHLYLCSP